MTPGEVRPAVWPSSEPEAEVVTPVDWSTRPRRVELVSFEPGGRIVSRPEPPPRRDPPPQPMQPKTEAALPPELPPEPALPEGMLLVSEDELVAREQALIDALQRPYLEAARRFEEAVADLDRRLREDVVDLAARIASALVHRELKMNRGLVLEVAQRALRLVGPLDRVTVKCAPEDADLLREHMPQIARTEVGRAVEVTVRPSDDITPGGLLLTFEGGVVDAREDRRLARITEAVKEALHAVDMNDRPGEGR